MKLAPNQVVSYRQLCEIEEQQQLQAGMSFALGSNYSVCLMSIKPNAPYADSVSADGKSIYYEGHDLRGDKTKLQDQPATNPNGSLTQNGKFITAIDSGQVSGQIPQVRVYEKLYPGIWNYRGLFRMVRYQYVEQNGRKVFKFEFTLNVEDLDLPNNISEAIKNYDIEQTRQIPGLVKLAVYKRDQGMCVKCGSKDNLHFDHLLPYSLGGTSLDENNIQLLCARHNLQKSNNLLK